MEGEAPSVTGEMLLQAKGATLISHLKACSACHAQHQREDIVAPLACASAAAYR